MKRNSFTVIAISLFAPIMLTACVTSSSSNTPGTQEPAGVTQEEYDAVLAELESEKEENEKLQSELAEYSDIIDALEKEDYSTAG